MFASRCCSAKTSALCLVSLLWLVLLGGAGAASAQFVDELAFSVTPIHATVDVPLVATVTGVASCPRVIGPIVGDGVVEVRVSSACAILPPSPAPFTIYSVIGTLSAGLWQIRLIEHDLDMVVDTLTISVTDPTFNVSLLPSPARADQEVIARVNGVSLCPRLEDAEIGDGIIRLNVGGLPGLCDPPAPEFFDFHQSLGMLESGAYAVEMYVLGTRVAESSLRVDPATGCIADSTTLCLNNGRFRVEATWEIPIGSDEGRAVMETEDTGFFWFFDRRNIELVVKVLNGCGTAISGYWVFAAGLTNVGVHLEVTDTLTGEMVSYDNPLGQVFSTITDTTAFLGACP